MIKETNLDKFLIAGREISQAFPPYVIAELSANHNGSIERAMEIIQKCKNAGADAVKIQTYTPDTITLNCSSPEFVLDGGLWDGRNLYDLYSEAYMPWDWHKALFDFAKKIDLTIFSSPFDNTAIDLLEDLNAPAYKIASFEAVDIPLIKYAASTQKPMIISTGMANETEIQEAIDAARSSGNGGVAILRCVSGYPAPSRDYNLATLKRMQDLYGVVTGLSDHTLNNTTAIASVALGAAIIEKHVTLDRSAGGPDDSFSLEPNQLEELCRSVKETWESIGVNKFGPTASEMGNIKFRRSLYFVKSLKVGDKIDEQSIRSVRPGYGLPPNLFDRVIGGTVRIDVAYGTPVSFDNVLFSES